MNTHLKNVKKWVSFGGLLALFVLAGPSWSQPGGGFGGPGPGGPGFGGPDGDGPGGGGRGGRGFGMGRPGGMRNSAKFKLSRWLDDVQDLDSNPKTALSKDQAKKILAAITPWQKKKTMTDQEATALHTRLMAILTTAQKNQLNAGGGFGRPGGFGGRGGGGGGFGGGFRGRDDDGPRGDGPPGEGFGGGRGGRRDGGGGGRGWGRDEEGGPDDGPPGPPPGGFGGEMSESEMQARRATMEAYLKSNNPFASPKSNPNFAKLPEMMRQMSLDRFKAQNDFVARLKKKAK